MRLKTGELMAAKIYRKAELRWPEGKTPIGVEQDACI
jgi:hypothetical protein